MANERTNSGLWWLLGIAALIFVSKQLETADTGKEFPGRPTPRGLDRSRGHDGVSFRGASFTITFPNPPETSRMPPRLGFLQYAMHATRVGDSEEGALAVLEAQLGRIPLDQFDQEMAQSLRAISGDPQMKFLDVREISHDARAVAHEFGIASTISTTFDSIDAEVAEFRDLHEPGFEASREYVGRTPDGLVVRVRAFARGTWFWILMVSDEQSIPSHVRSAFFDGFSATVR